MIAARRICQSLLVVMLMSLAGLARAEIHTWTDSTGKYQTEAEFVSLVKGVVTLRKKDGKQVSLPLKRLSKDDQSLAEELARLPKPSPRPAPTTQPPNNPTTQQPNNVINSVRGAGYSTETINNMRQIALAIMNYESARGRLPAAAIMTADRKPGLSWRVALLPYLEEDNLYRQFRRDEPWDSPHNKPLVERMPKVFQSPGSSLARGYTNYLAIRSPDAMLVDAPRGIRLRDVRDGTSNTISFLEVDDDHAAIWTQPNEYEWNPAQPFAGIGNIWSGRFYAAFGDARVEAVFTSLPAETIGALFTRSGGERIQLPLR